MPVNRPTFVNQLLEIWSRLQWPQKLTIIFFGLLGLILIGSIVYFMNRVEYQVFYRDLNPEDAQAIVTELKEQKKDYKVRGRDILVAAPEEDIDKLRLEIAGSGLAQSGKIGFEIFDQSQFGMTDFTEQVNLQRALEGELARTISSLSEITRARVHIVLPKNSVFQDRNEEAKASVVLTLKKGAELAKSSVSGIKGVVAGAVPGLNTHHVSIVDDDGKYLSQSAESGDTGRAEMESGIREQLEKQMSNKVISILEPVVGKGKVHANTSIDLDFNTTEQTEETYNPNPPAIVSQQRSEERAGGRALNTTSSGIPGTQSNLGEASAQTVLPTTSERVRNSELTNYELSKTVRHTVQPKGTILRLSVAVILDHKAVYTKTKEGKVISHSEPRSQDELDAYRELVLAAVGYDELRGDVVTIENVPFFSELKPEEQQPATPWYLKWQQNSYILHAMKYGAYILLFIIIYLMVFRPIRRRVYHALSAASLGPGESEEAQLESGTVPKALPDGAKPEELAAATAEGAQTSLQEGEGAPSEDMVSLETATDEQIERELIREANTVDMGGRKYVAMRKKLMEKAKRDPEMISLLIRSLLREKA
jgi:flagellar M-ring protein FliF